MYIKSLRLFICSFYYINYTSGFVLFFFFQFSAIKSFTIISNYLSNLFVYISPPQLIQPASLHQICNSFLQTRENIYFCVQYSEKSVLLLLLSKTHSSHLLNTFVLRLRCVHTEHRWKMSQCSRQTHSFLDVILLLKFKTYQIPPSAL